MSDWNKQLRTARERLGITREALADRVGLSPDSLRSYELGRRRPRPEHLSDMLKCLEVDKASRDRILADAGFAGETPIDRFLEPNVPTKEAVRIISERPLPAFLLNSRTEILAVSGAAWKLAGLADLGLKPRVPRSLLTQATRRALATRVANWEQLAVRLIAAFKAGVPEEQSLETPGPYLDSVLKQLCAGDPALIKRFAELWELTPPFEGRMTAATYPTIWRAPGGEIRFNCFIGCLNTEVGLYAHTWVPADAKSHLLLEKLLANPANTSAHEPSSRGRRRGARTS